MKRKHFTLSSILLGIMLFAGNQAWAQKDTTMWMVMNEYRVHDQSIFEKNYPVVRAFWLKADTGTSDRIGHTSESGRVYTLALFKGAQNFGAFMGKRVKINDAFEKAQPAINKQNTQNLNGAVVRSIWVRVDSLSRFEPGYKMVNYDFRKMNMISVTADKIKEYEANAYKLGQMDDAHGIHYNVAVFRCTEGYPTNTYLVFLPDKSLMDYYKNRDMRYSKRAQFKNDYDPMRRLATDLSLIVRIDHLDRVK